MQYDIWSSIFGVEFCEAIIIIIYLWKFLFAIEYPRLSEVNYTH